MDVQLKKGIIEACVLASLKRSDTYGYELLKRVTPILEVSESTLYPILRRLEKSGSLTTYSIEYEGRLRKYYKITKEGVNKLEVFIHEWQDVVKVYDFIIGR
jgi:PadR family transcriptional regulator, regulatory protein PadR